MKDNQDKFLPQMDEESPRYKEELSRKERLWFILGAIKSSLLIGLAYAVGLGIVILLMYLSFIK